MRAVLYAEDAGVARVTLNRPDRLNAINADLAAGLAAALARAAATRSVEAIILAGAGRAFCAGDDLEELAAGQVDARGAEAFIGHLQDATRTMMFGGKPVICAAQGWIVGGAAAWVLNADFSIVADDATLFCPEASHGLFPTGGASLLLPQRAGSAVANRVLWLGARLSAQQMVDHGLAHANVPADRLAGEAEALARRLLALPPASRRRLKQALADDLRDRLELALDFEARCCLEAAQDPAVRARVAARR
ncbi:enoyl-CoA hydratase/isomerase family protein [Caulobacter mirabilis]|uniref:Enoyl-CoA hydratase n=1 Tax=Caulobacter mirabilis TaxID=69666 RepID=A0A2D2B2U1_9CAUL|nr:enoyl-CoA hydratase/isomerase family protein [Caulobacter mirabilis]ATQ44585.1 enoyl-CoA hydratase [Caulobacter mirabilis]